MRNIKRTACAACCGWPIAVIVRGIQRELDCDFDLGVVSGDVVIDPRRRADDLIVGRELASFISLETEFAMATGSSRMAGCLLPRDDAGAFVTFLRWAAARGDAHRPDFLRGTANC